MSEKGELPDVSPEALVRAEAALAGLSQRYLEWASDDAARLCACMREIMEGQVSLEAGLPHLFTIAHDMKGQAATFGYPLVSELGNRLCRLIEEEPAPGHAALPRLVRLADAMAQVIAQRLDGDGGETGRRLLDET